MKLTHSALAVTVFALSFSVWADDMPGMKMDGTGGSSASSAQVASAEGTIKAINHEKHSVTIAHGAVPAVQWPPMTMAFSVTENQISGLQVGDKVSFSFSQPAGKATIVSIKK